MLCHGGEGGGGDGCGERGGGGGDGGGEGTVRHTTAGALVVPHPQPQLWFMLQKSGLAAPSMKVGWYRTEPM